MRGLTILLIAAAFAVGASAQPKPIVDDQTRFGITPNLDLYPQNTPKAALDTATKLLENKRYEYFVAHVLDPAFLEAKILDRAQKLTREVELQLLQKRDEQKLNPDKVNSRDKLPIEPKAFAEAVREEAITRSFKFVVQDLRAHLFEYPENLKTFRKLLVAGEVVEAGTTATFTHKDIPGKSVYLKNNGKRWFLEDKQVDEPKPMPEK
jgi:hypothetical protein